MKRVMPNDQDGPNKRYKLDATPLNRNVALQFRAPVANRVRSMAFVVPTESIPHTANLDQVSKLIEKALGNTAPVNNVSPQKIRRNRQ